MKRLTAVVCIWILLMQLTGCKTTPSPEAVTSPSTTTCATATTTTAVTTTTTTIITTTTTTTTTTIAPTTTTEPTTAAPTTVPPTEPTTVAPTTAPTAAPTTAAPTTKATTAKTTEATKTVITTTTNAPASASVTETGYVVTAEQIAQIKNGFLRLINEERARVGAAPLVPHAHLEGCAQIRSEELVASWTHTRPNGDPFYTVLDTSQYAYSAATENIGMTTYFAGSYNDTYHWDGSAAQIEAAYTRIYEIFRNSEGHYNSFISSTYEHSGVGISYVWFDDGIPMFYVSHLLAAD